jgi:hypothetical protein
MLFGNALLKNTHYEKEIIQSALSLGPSQLTLKKIKVRYECTLIVFHIMALNAL